MEFELKTFLPAAAEGITGVSQVSQRKYRQLGYLRSHDGRDARHSLFDLTAMLTVKILNARDLPHASIAPWIASAIARRVLEFEAAYVPDAGLEGVDLTDLAGEVLAQHSPLGENSALRMPRFFVTLANGEGGFYDSLDLAFFDEQAAKDPARLVGSIVAIDTLALAAEMLARADGRPFVSVAPVAVEFEAFSKMSLGLVS